MSDHPKSYIEDPYRFQKHMVTGQHMPVASTIYPTPLEHQDIRPTSASKRELIDRYYLEPLSAMNGDMAFVALSLCFLLYEKFLRRTGKIKRAEKFHQSSRVFEYIGSDLGISKDLAFLIWRDWRNGLLHSGMPLTLGNLHWELDGHTKKNRFAGQSKGCSESVALSR